jgi:LEA14-like dessication related protein
MKHKGRWIFLSILILILLGIGILFLIQYSHYAKDKSPYRTLFIPRLELGVFEITNLEADRIDLNSKMLIHNPLPVNLAADSMSYRLYISGVEVIKSSYPKSVNIEHWDSSWINMPVTVYTEKLLNILDREDKRGKDSVVYGVKATFYTHIPFKKEFNVDVDKLLPIFYIPTLELAKLDYDSFSLKGVTLYIHTRIGNRNKFPFVFKNLKYKFALADYPWVSGAKPGVIDIRERDTTDLTLPLRISFTGIFKSLGPLIRKGGKTDYKLGLDLRLVAESNAIRDSKVVVSNHGTVKEIVQLAKESKQKDKEEKKRERKRKRIRGQEYASQR